VYLPYYANKIRQYYRDRMPSFEVENLSVVFSARLAPAPREKNPQWLGTTRTSEPFWPLNLATASSGEEA
jgi:hypothetical protein